MAVLTNTAKKTAAITAALMFLLSGCSGAENNSGSVADSSSGNSESTESSSGNGEITESSSGNGEITESSSGNGEITESSSGNGEITESSSGNDEITESSSGNDEITESSSGNDESTESTVDREDKLVIGFDSFYYPLFYEEKNDATGKNEITGFAMDYARALADSMGLVAEFTAVGSNVAAQALDNNDVDAMISFNNAEYIEQVEKGSVYFEDCVVFAVPTDSEIKSVDMINKSVSVSKGSIAEKQLQNVSFEGLVMISVLPLERESCKPLLTNSQAALINRSAALYDIAHGGAFRMLPEEYAGAEYYLTFSKKDSERKSTLISAEQQLRDDGGFEKVYSEWFGE